MNSKKCIYPAYKLFIFLFLWSIPACLLTAHSSQWYTHFYSLANLESNVTRFENTYTVDLYLPQEVTELYLERFSVFLLIPSQYHSPAITVESIDGFWLFSDNCIYDSFSYQKGTPPNMDHLEQYSWDRVPNRLVQYQAPMNIRGYSVIRLDLRPYMVTEPPYYIYTHSVRLELQFEEKAKRDIPMRKQTFSSSDENSFLQQMLLNPEDMNNYKRTVPLSRAPGVHSGIDRDAQWALRIQPQDNGFHYLWGKDILAHKPPSTYRNAYSFYHHALEIPWTIYPETKKITPESLLIFHIPSEVTSPVYLTVSPENSANGYLPLLDNPSIDKSYRHIEHTALFSPALNYDPQNGTPYWNDALVRNHYPFFLQGIDNRETEAKITVHLESSRHITPDNWNNAQKNASARILLNEEEINDYELVFSSDRRSILVRFSENKLLQNGLNILTFHLNLENSLNNVRLYSQKIEVKGKLSGVSFRNVDRPRSLPEDVIVQNDNGFYFSNALYDQLYTATFANSWMGNNFFSTLYYSISSEQKKLSNLRSGIWTEERKFQNLQTGLNFLFFNQYSPEKRVFRLFPDQSNTSAQDKIFITMRPYLDSFSHLIIASHNLEKAPLGKHGEQFFLDLALPLPEENAPQYLAIVDLEKGNRLPVSSFYNENTFSFPLPSHSNHIPDPDSPVKGGFISCLQPANITPVRHISDDYLTQLYQDIIVLTPDYFLSSLKEELASLHILDQVTILPVETIFDHFNHGIKCPEAIRNFLGHLAASSESPPLHVVLLGNASLDPEEYYQVPNWIPVYPHATGNITIGEELTYGMIGSRGFFYTLFRLPVSTREELHIFFTKYREYLDASFQPHQQRLIFGVDDFFESYAGQKSPGGAPDYFIEPVFIKDYPQRINPFFGQDTTRTNTQADRRFIDEINRGAPLIYYTGHGGPILLAHERLLLALRRSDSHMHYLNNGPFYPFFVTYTCYTGKHFLNKPPHDFSFGETLLLTPGKGTIASYMPITAGVPREQALIAQIMNYGLFEERLYNLGELHWMLVNYYPLIKGDSKLIREHVFFGFPTLNLQIEHSSATKIDPSFTIDTKRRQWEMVFDTPRDILSLYSHPLKEIAWKQIDEHTIRGQYEGSFFSIFPLQMKSSDNHYLYVQPDMPHAGFQFLDQNDILKNIIYKKGEYFLHIKARNLRLHHRILGKRGQLNFYDQEGNRISSRRVRFREEGSHLVNITSFIHQNKHKKITLSLDIRNFPEYDTSMTLYPPLSGSSFAHPLIWNVFPFQEEIDNRWNFIRLNLWNWEGDTMRFGIEYPSKTTIQSAPMRIFNTQFTLEEKEFNADKLLPEHHHIIKKHPYLDHLTIEKISRTPDQIINGDTIYYRYRIKNPTDYYFRDVLLRIQYQDEDSDQWRRDRRVGPDMTINIPPHSHEEITVPAHIIQAVGNIKVRLSLRYGPLFYSEKNAHTVEILPFPDLSVNGDDFDFQYDSLTETFTISGTLKSDTALKRQEVTVHIQANDHNLIHTVMFEGKQQNYRITFPLPPDNYSFMIMFNPQLRIPETTRANNSVSYNYIYRGE